jgi:hypothetical protein
MQLKKFFKRLVLLVLLVGLGYGINYCRVSFPIISGYGAKNVCSAVFISNRDPKEVIAH